MSEETAEAVVETALAYVSLLKIAMIQPDMKRRWQDSHLALLQAVDLHQRSEAAEPVKA